MGTRGAFQIFANWVARSGAKNILDRFYYKAVAPLEHTGNLCKKRRRFELHPNEDFHPKNSEKSLLLPTIFIYYIII